jgi:hypothetical protein
VAHACSRQVYQLVLTQRERLCRQGVLLSGNTITTRLCDKRQAGTTCAANCKARAWPRAGC